MTTIKTRFAPSPTGHLHIGGARTAILSSIVAEKLSGDFLLRIEDTDTARSSQEYTQSILKSLDWLDIHYSNEPVYQSSRYDHYKAVALDLIDKGLAYYCYSTPEELNAKRLAHGSHGGWKYDNFWRDNTSTPPAGVSPTIRLKVDTEGSCVWNDFIKGQISIDKNQLDDFIILRSDGSPTYNFCVAIDDSDMGISHVIRGEDHIGNTPKQIAIYEALGKPIPTFGHVPLILNPDGTKMSKSDKAASLDYYKDLGILPEALTNYLLLMSCNSLDSEIMDRPTFVSQFNLDKLGNSPVKFDMDKLYWINKEYLKQLDSTSFESYVKSQLDSQDILEGDWSAIQPGVIDRSKGIYDFKELILPLMHWNKDGLSDPLLSQALKYVLSQEDVSPQAMHDNLKAWTDNQGMKFGELMKPMRSILFPDMKLPIHEALAFIGKDRLMELLDKKASPKP